MAVIETIEQHKEGYSVPAAAYQVILRIAGQEYDISERLNSEPGIVDAADYQEGLSYVNEVSMMFDNSDNSLYDETGGTRGSLLNDVTEVELLIYMYLNVPGYTMAQKLAGKILKFGGFVKLETIKTDNIQKTIEFTGMSYLGILGERSGSRICTRDFRGDGGNNGLSLADINACLKDAAIAGFELKRGVHKIYAKFEPPEQFMKLDDGEWVEDSGSDFTLINGAGNQKVTVNGFGFAGADEAFSTIIVLEQGQQYPFILYRDAAMIEIAGKCFEIGGITEKEMEPFEVKTYDDDHRFSKYPPIRFESFNPWVSNCMVSDNDRYAYCGLGNELWRRDLVYHINVKMLNYNTDYEIKRLIYSADNNLLFVFTEGAGDPHRNLYKVDLTTYTSTKIFNRFDLLGIDVYNSIQWSEYLNKFLFVRSAAEIATVDLGGTIENIHTGQTLLKTNGTSWVWETEFEVTYFFTRRHASDTYWQIYKTVFNKNTATWAAPIVHTNLLWTPTEPINGDAIAYVFNSENKAVLYKAFINDVEPIWMALNCATAGFNIFYMDSDYVFHSPFEWKRGIYLIATGVDQRIAILQGNVISFHTPEYIGDDLTYGGFDIRDMQRLCVHKNWVNEEILNIMPVFDFQLLRYSRYVVPFISGDCDYTDVTVKDALQDVANIFLAFVRVNAERKGWFVARGSYTTGRTMTFKKQYIQQRGKEVVYSEKYDGVEIDNGSTLQSWGEFGPEDNILSLSHDKLPTIILLDISKYYFEYYSVERHIMSITYLPGFLESEPMDDVLFSGIETYLANIKLHEYAPAKGAAEYRLLGEVAE